MGETRVKQSKRASKRAGIASDSVKGKSVKHIEFSVAEVTPSSTSETSAYRSSNECLSLVGNADFFTADPSYIEQINTESKGVALFAARKIPAGTLILAETPLIRLTQSEEDIDKATGSNKVHPNLTIQFENLSKPDKKLCLSLHNTEKREYSTIKSIFYSNCYNLSGPNKPSPSSPGGACIANQASRFNHSCIPNVQFSFNEAQNLMLFHAIKPIPRGKELVSNYDTVYELRSHRQAKNQMFYCFTCDCEACEPGYSEFWAKSDDRRKTMIALKKELEVCEKRWEKDGVLRDGRDPVGTLKMLEVVMVKEGLLGVHLADVYRDWAGWAERLGDGNEVREAGTRELKLCVTITGAHSVRVRNLRLKLEAVCDGRV